MELTNKQWRMIGSVAMMISSIFMLTILAFLMTLL
jgi:hypothetical protein